MAVTYKSDFVFEQSTKGYKGLCNSVSGTSDCPEKTYIHAAVTNVPCMTKIMQEDNANYVYYSGETLACKVSLRQ